MKYILLLFILGLSVEQASSAELDMAQIRGMRNLLESLDGVYATCNMILFSEMVDYKTADDNCKNFDIGKSTKYEGNLATVNDEDKNMQLMLLLSMAYTKNNRTKKGDKWAADQWVWAGMRKTQNNKGNRKAKKYNPEDWEWADGSHPKDYEHGCKISLIRTRKK